MSHRLGVSDDGDLVDSETSGVAALRASSAFRGPVEPIEGHDHSNDHFALLYEDGDEQLVAAAQFLQQGLDRGERCLYVADDNDRSEVLAALRDCGVDVEAAVDAGALSVRTPEDTYRRTGEFDREEMLAFWEDALAEATDDDGYEGIRATAEMTWALEDDTDLDGLVEYEAVLNRLYEGEDYTVCCQYDTERFPAAVLRDVVRTHPHVIDGDVVHDNVYYTPPEEFFEPEAPDSEVERMLGTLRERTETKTELQEHKQYLRRLYETTADADRSFEEKLAAVIDLGRDQFDLDVGGLARVDPDADEFEVEATRGDHEYLRPGTTCPLSETYCREATENAEVAAVTDPVPEAYRGKLCYDRFGVRTYLGTHVALEDGPDRTFWFASNELREAPFSEADRTFVHLMGQWVEYELERQRYEDELEETVERLQQSNDRLKQFAYAASHDLQEPLRMISSYLRLLENQYADELSPDARECVDFAVDGADRMRGMVDDLLTYSRLEQQDESFTLVDCDVLLERVTDDLQVQIDEHDATIRADDLPTVVGDPEKLQHLLRNLVSNAVKYGGDGPVQVDVAVEDRGDHWEFSVSDDGIGIEPEKTDVIFEVFQRLHHDDEYSGTGIGLALCQEIVEHHGGDIWVESEPGVGSTFSFTLPERARR